MSSRLVSRSRSGEKRAMTSSRISVVSSTFRSIASERTNAMWSSNNPRPCSALRSCSTYSQQTHTVITSANITRSTALRYQWTALRCWTVTCSCNRRPIEQRERSMVILTSNRPLSISASLSNDITIGQSVNRGQHNTTSR